MNLLARVIEACERPYKDFVQVRGNKIQYAGVNERGCRHTWSVIWDTAEQSFMLLKEGGDVQCGHSPCMHA